MLQFCVLYVKIRRFTGFLRNIRDRRVGFGERCVKWNFFQNVVILTEIVVAMGGFVLVL